MPNPTELLQDIVVDEPVQAEGLLVFPLRWSPGGRLAYATLDEGLSSGTLEITEIHESGSVPTLRVTNKSDLMAFLMAGEHLVGAKQDRVLNASIMVAAGADMPIPVSCVEHGRWAYRGRRFSSSGRSSHGLLRRIMAQQVKDSYRSMGAPRSDQGAVWKEVQRKLEALKSQSDTSALDQTYKDHEKKLQAFLTGLTPPQGACGAVFALGGRIAGCDLFDKPETFVKLWPKLVRAYAIDALEETGATTPMTVDAVRAWLRASADAKAETFKSAGLGNDIRLESSTHQGACLVVEEEPVHVEMFAETW